MYDGLPCNVKTILQPNILTSVDIFTAVITLFVAVYRLYLANIMFHCHKSNTTASRVVISNSVHSREEAYCTDKEA